MLVSIMLLDEMTCPQLLDFFIYLKTIIFDNFLFII